MIDLLIDFILTSIRLLLSIVLSAGALYTGISLLDRLTPGIDEWKLIKSGNAAVGLFYGAVMISIFIMVAPAIEGFELAIPGMIFSVINYAVALLAAIIVVYLTIHVADRLTADLDEFAELEKGNLAVAVVLSVVIIGVVLAASQPLETLLSIIKSAESMLF